MNRKEFLEQLSDCLSSLSKEERDEALLYYEEFFEDAGTVYEQDVIRELGSPQKLAESIMNDSAINDERGLVIKQNYTENTKSQDNSTSYKNESKTKNVNTQEAAQKPKQKDNTSLIIGIILIVVTAPIWGSILGSILSVVLGVIFTVAVTVVTLGVLGVVFLSQE